jgi:hypothetical protein
MTKKDDPDRPNLTLVRQELGTVVDNKLVDELTTGTRREAMLKAWAAGYTFQEIADKWNFRSAGFARAAIERALADTDIVLDRKAERDRFTSSLLGHHKVAAELAADPDEPERMAWMRMDLIVIDRLAKLMGLDAPTQIVINPGADEFEQLTTQLAIAAGAVVPVEADPMGGA